MEKKKMIKERLKELRELKAIGSMGLKVREKELEQIELEITKLSRQLKSSNRTHFSYNSQLSNSKYSM